MENAGPIDMASLRDGDGAIVQKLICAQALALERFSVAPFARNP